MRTSATALGLASLLALAPSVALADVLPPNATCGNKKAGDSCETEEGKTGACKASECSRLDYSLGTPPGTEEYDCMLCVEGEATSAPTGSSSGNGKSRRCAVGIPVPAGEWWLAALARWWLRELADAGGDRGGRLRRRAAAVGEVPAWCRPHHGMRGRGSSLRLRSGRGHP
jgi:hypothetical protein